VALSLSSVAVLPPSIHFASIQIASVQADHPQTNTFSADSNEAWISFTDLTTLAWPVALITVEEMWRNVVEERDNRGAPLVDNFI